MRRAPSLAFTKFVRWASVKEQVRCIHIGHSCLDTPYMKRQMSLYLGVSLTPQPT